MSALNNSSWAPVSKSLAIEPAFASRFDAMRMRNKWNLFRFTLAVLGTQAVIRLMIMMRQLNY
jgi:hypothetical protein